MIGQVSILNYIDSFKTFFDFPKSLIIDGEIGSGKKLIVQKIANRFNLDIDTIEESISRDRIEDMYLESIPKVYSIDCSDLSIKEQNSLLKIVEEPPKNAIIIFRTTNFEDLLPTLINRCIVLHLDKYTFEQLFEFDNRFTKEMFVYAKTPGMVSLAVSCNIADMESFCTYILNRISTSTYSSILTIQNKIDFNQTGNGMNYMLFCIVLDKVAHDMFIANKIKSSSYLIIHDLLQSSKIKNINRFHLFNSFIMRLKNDFK